MESILNFLRDSIWGFILGVIAIYLAIRYAPRTRKELSWDVIYNGSILSPTIVSTFKGDIELQFLDSKGNIVQNGHLLILRIWNSGNQAIKEDDYQSYNGKKQLLFVFGQPQEIDVLRAQLFETPPDNPEPSYVFSPLEPTPLCHTNFVSLAPIGLNEEDSIDLQIILNKFVTKNEVKIIGKVSDLKKFNGPSNSKITIKSTLLNAITYSYYHRYPLRKAFQREFRRYIKQKYQ